MTPRRRYLTEIHDVHPGMRPKLDTLLSALPESARSIALLLVVPDWCDGERLDRHSEFAELVGQHPGEKVLHGFSHSLGPSWFDRVWYGTENESEFARLSESEAKDRIRQGCEVFESCFGSPPRWFCAPRWRQSSGTSDALAARGFEGYMLTGAYRAFTAPAFSAPALWFDEGKREWKNSIARVTRRRRIAQILRDEKPFRLVLHPRDPEDPKTWRQVTELIAALEERGWKPMSLDQALGR